MSGIDRRFVILVNESGCLVRQSGYADLESVVGFTTVDHTVDPILEAEPRNQPVPALVTFCVPQPDIVSLG